MKKSLLISLTAISALSMAAQTKIVWDFNTHGIFKEIQDENGPKFYDNNYDFVDATGATKNTDQEMMVTCEKVTPEDGSPAYYNQWGKNNRLISLFDGLTYSFTADEACKNGTLDNPYYYKKGEEIAPGKFEDDIYEPRDAAYKANLHNHPFISWAQAEEGQQSLGPSRMIWMKGWGSEDAWVDANHNAVDADNWVSSKHAFGFSRCNQGKGALAGSYIQFPAVQAPMKVTYYVESSKGKKAGSSKALKYKIDVVVDGKIVEGKGEAVNEPNNTDGGTIVQNRYYKRTFNYDGNEMASLRITCDGQELSIMQVEIECAGSQTGIVNIAADAEDENAPVYNLMGIQVDETYKGIVIKNGKKYVQR